jgi:hypothetical protein
METQTGLLNIRLAELLKFHLPKTQLGGLSQLNVPIAANRLDFLRFGPSSSFCSASIFVSVFCK